jgi:hypothetical protein
MNGDILKEAVKRQEFFNNVPTQFVLKGQVKLQHALIVLGVHGSGVIHQE